MFILSKDFFEEEKAEKKEKPAVSNTVENNDEVLKHLNMSVKLEQMDEQEPDEKVKRIF
jgi:hypothetical protein